MCPFCTHMEISVSVCLSVCLCPFYVYIWRSLYLSVLVTVMPIWKSVTIIWHFKDTVNVVNQNTMLFVVQTFILLKYHSLSNTSNKLHVPTHCFELLKRISDQLLQLGNALHSLWLQNLKLVVFCFARRTFFGLKTAPTKL